MNEITATKQCNKCKTVKPVTEFIKSTRTKDNLSFYCKDCERERLKLYYSENKAKISKKHDEYYSNNRDKIKEKQKEWLEENKEKMKEYFKEYHKEWYKKNPDKLKEYQKNAYMKKLNQLLNKQDEDK